jgi:hypothetical protein
LEVVSLAWEYFDSVVVVVVEIVGLVGTRISIWRRNGQEAFFHLVQAPFLKAFVCVTLTQKL